MQTIGQKKLSNCIIVVITWNGTLDDMEFRCFNQCIITGIYCSIIGRKIGIHIRTYNSELQMSDHIIKYIQLHRYNTNCYPTIKFRVSLNQK